MSGKKSASEGKKDQFPGGSRQTSITLATGDEVLLQEIQQHLGVGQSDAIRTAIRVYAAILKK